MSVYDGDLTNQASAYSVSNDDSNTLPSTWTSGMGGIDKLLNGGRGYEISKDMIDRIFAEQQLEKAREWQVRSDASARAWEEYFDSTKYQRMMKDLKAAGLNPWLALNSLNGSSAVGQSSGTTPSYKSSKLTDGSGDSIAGRLITTALGLLILKSMK